MSKKNLNCNYSKSDRMERDYERKVQLECLASHLGLDEYSTTELFLITLLHTVYITRDQIVSLGFCTKNSINSFLKPFRRDAFIKDYTYKKNNKQKVFTLSKKGFSYLQLWLDDEYLEKWNIKYREIRKVKGYIEHRWRTNDLFILLLSNPQVGEVYFIAETEATLLNGEEKVERKDVVVRLDGRFLIDGMEYWLEQDMGTLNLNQLKDKFNRLRRLKNTYSKTVDLIITVSLENLIDNYNRNRLFSNILEVRVITIMNNISKGLEINKNIYEYMEIAKENSEDTNFNGVIRNNYREQFEILNDLYNNHDVETIDDFNELKKLIINRAEIKKKEIINKKLDKLYLKRQDIIYKALFNNENVRMDEMVYKGMNIYTVQNRDLSTFVHNDYFSDSPLIERVKQKYEFLYMTTLSGYKKNGMVGKEMDYVPLNNIYSGLLKFVYFDESINEKRYEEYQGEVVIEDYMYNLASRKRLERAFEKLPFGIPLDIIIIVKDEQEINQICKCIKNQNRTYHKYTRIFFEQYDEMDIFEDKVCLKQYVDGEIIEIYRKKR